MDKLSFKPRFFAGLVPGPTKALDRLTISVEHPRNDTVDLPLDELGRPSLPLEEVSQGRERVEILRIDAGSAGYFTWLDELSPKATRRTALGSLPQTAPCARSRNVGHKQQPSSTSQGEVADGPRAGVPPGGTLSESCRDAP